MMPRAVVCVPAVPEYDRQSGGRRIVDLVEFLQEDGWGVTLVARLPGRERYAQALRRRGVLTVTGVGPDIEAVVAHERFDLAIVAFWHLAEEYLPRLRAASPATKVIVDSLDLHFVRNARRLAVEGGHAGGRADSASEDEMQARRELEVYGAADAVLTVSDAEAAVVDERTGRAGHARTVPDCEHGGRSRYSFGERRGLLFIGNFRHPPNVSAVELLCREIVPRLSPETLAAHPVWVVGNALEGTALEACAGVDGVSPIGWVPSVVPYLQRARVSVVPVPYGAGTNRKLIQALMVGTPTVATPVAAEGIDVLHERELLVADEPAEFAAAVERLVADEQLWKRLADRGRERIERTHSREAVQRRFREILEHVSMRGSAGNGRSALRSVGVSPPSAGAAPAFPPSPRTTAERPGGVTAEPVFVIGSPRSGTSVLTWALGQHSNLLPLEESDWLAKLGVNLLTSYVLGTARGPRSALASMGVEERDFLAAFGEAVDALLLRHRARYDERRAAAGEDADPRFRIARTPADPKRRWVDGTPEYSNHVVPLRLLFPRARFVHILRDVESVARSLVHFSSIGGPSFTRQRAYQKWLKNVQACVEAERAFGSEIVLRVRHRDLVERPEATLRRCLDFLGEQFEPTCLEPLERKINASVVPEAAAADEGGDVEPRLKRTAEKLSAKLLADGAPRLARDEKLVAALEARYRETALALETFYAGRSVEIAGATTSANGTAASDAGEAERNVMKADWDARARENAMHYVASRKEEWDEQEFFESGRVNVEDFVVADLERICGAADPKQMRMLEIGCGVGRMTRHLADLFGEVHAVDVSGEMIARARRHFDGRTNVRLYETDGSDLSPFADGFFDFAFSFIVFQHIPFREAIVAYLHEVHRTLKPRRLFKFQVQGVTIKRPNTWTGVGFSEDELRAIAEEIGFDVLQTDGAGTQYFWNWWRRR
jgi:SAM-dependent methyltransferase